MRINAINNQIYSKQNDLKMKSLGKQKVMQNAMHSSVGFKGASGAIIGGSTGAIVGTVLAVFTGGLSIPIGYLGGLLLGGYAGHKIEGDD